MEEKRARQQKSECHFVHSLETRKQASHPLHLGTFQMIDCICALHSVYCFGARSITRILTCGEGMLEINHVISQLNRHLDRRSQ